ncbi:MAG: hypothetical protein MJD61_07385 [Proteobacteria bacterium]|nr:hypothetical protein [Pseudomonadota bacterium]
MTGAKPAVPLTLYSSRGEALVAVVTDEHGQAHFSYTPTPFATLTPGPGGQRFPRAWSVPAASFLRLEYFGEDRAPLAGRDGPEYRGYAEK